MWHSDSSKDNTLKDKIQECELFPHTSAPWQQDILNNFLRLVPQKNDSVCLDAAGGVGNNIENLQKFFRKVVLLDRSSDAMDFAKERFEYVDPDILTFKQGHLEQIDVEDNYFDCVVCTEALEHVQDHTVVLRELYRVIKKDGYLILSFQNHFNFSAIIKFVFERLTGKNWDAWGTHGHLGGYESYLTCFQVKKTLKNVGFTSVVELGADYINAWLSWLPFLHRNYRILDKYPLLFLGKLPLIKYLGMDYFLILKKI